MSENQPKVSKLAAGGWMITQKPKSITVSWKSPAHLWMRVASTLWKLWALQAVSIILPGSPVLVRWHFIFRALGHRGSMDGSVMSWVSSFSLVQSMILILFYFRIRGGTLKEKDYSQICLCYFLFYFSDVSTNLPDIFD